MVRSVSASIPLFLLLLLPGRGVPVTHAESGKADTVKRQLQVVSSLTTYAAIAREVAGPRAVVTSIANGSEDPHFVQPKPSFVVLLSKADLFVTTGLDLELWVPALLDKAGNRKVRNGERGFVAAYSGIPLLDVPASVSRARGDIHVFGNPHVWTDPVNAAVIARNIAAGLQRVDPDNAEEYGTRAAIFAERIAAALVGEELADILGSETVIDLGIAGELTEFIEANTLEGTPLAARLGGWMARARELRGREIACYHKEWDYFNLRFGLSCITYIEPKPGIPPSPRHVEEVIRLMRERKIPVLFASTYFDPKQITAVAKRTGARAVVVPTNTRSSDGIDTYFDLLELWIRTLTAAFAG
jgi:ABC-type Zn uptake system ZnuABC Zn-binding protein ZnuA